MIFKHFIIMESYSSVSHCVTVIHEHDCFTSCAHSNGQHSGDNIIHYQVTVLNTVKSCLVKVYH